MSALDDILERARANPKHIVLPEGEDPRIVDGAIRAKKEGIATPILLGNSDKVSSLLEQAGATASEFQIIDPSTSERAGTYAESYEALRRHKGVDLEAARAAIANPLNFGAMMVRLGDADGSLAGAITTTADTVRAALQIIGRADGEKTVSSCFLMILDQPHHMRKGTVVFADCGLVVEPTPEQLAAIAISSASSFESLVGGTPKVAMLSFSTAGSASHPRVTRVKEATEIARGLHPDLTLFGEIQFDAAFVPSVGASKAPDSPLKGDANILVFPNLEAANIGYKIAQRIGGATALGPILQGLAHPANDLSRGCSAEDVFSMIAVTAVQAK
ncbi:MAG: phosphate acetyltransferase [Proteobacteria bacterium]|nr:phosphate acetyltransferase [Pseudomonadota bacterium]